MSSELDEFKTEILETLDRAEEALLSFDQLPDGQSARVLYDEVFRAYHNIKGAAGMMEWEELQHHVHQLENILMQSKDSSTIPKKLIGWFLKGNDATRAIIAGTTYQFDYNLSNDSSSGNTSVTTKTSLENIPEEFYAEVNEGLEKISNTLIKMETDSGNKSLLDLLYREIHSIKGASQLFGFAAASTLAHTMESSLEQHKGKDQFEIDRGHVNTLFLCIDLMGQCLKRPDAEDISKEVNFMNSLLAPFITETITEVPEATVPHEVPAAPVAQAVAAPQNVDNEKSESTIRVQVSLLDRLMTLMGEMVLVRNQVLQYSHKTDDQEFLNLSQKLDVVTSELQEETMKTRMQPIGNILTKFQRVVRDLSGSLNKKINLNLHGVETELDKTLIEAVKDPLTHIVRNACDHGIETPEQRASSGKSEMGNITIKAYHEGGHVIVDISDDGKGLSRDKLINKALEKNIIDKAQAEKMSDREVQALIFAPGFSTAEKVTNVSGRGVGMDVVKSNIERIGGLVEISSVEGEGTKITLKIPLTLAIVPAMIVCSQNDRFAIPQVKLVELVRIERSCIESLQGRPIYRLRGNILPLIEMKEVLGYHESAAQNEEAINIVVLNSESHLFGLIVDEILDTADIVVKPLAQFLKPISIYSGATVLGDGNVAFIMDVLGIAQKHLGSGIISDDHNLTDKYSGSGMEGELREFVLVNLGSKTKHAIPLSMVSRMEEIKTSSIELSGYQRVIRYRGGILKIINLNTVFGYPENEVEKDITQVIVAKMGDLIFALEVDQIIDVLSTRDFLDESLSNHEAIVGNLVTQNEIIVVVDVERIYELSQPKKELRMVHSENKAPRILIVEDTDSIRNSIAQTLTDIGYEVEMAVDGLDGLKKIAGNSSGFDLILSDIEMPRMNGFEFAKKIRSFNHLRHIPLVAFTTKNTQSDLQEAKNSGFNTFLEKSRVKLLPNLIKECLTTSKRKSA